MNVNRWLSASFILFVVVLGLGVVKFGQIQAAIAFAETFPEPSATVKSTYAKSTLYTQSTKVIGQVQASQSITISNEYAGEITYVGFQPGDVVKENQILLRIDNSVEQANLIAAEARLKLAKLTASRFEELLQQSRISQDEVDRSVAEVSIANAEVKNLSAIINKKIISAPFAGRVGLAQFQVGELLNANSEITSLVGLSEKIRVNFAIPQTLPQVSIGDQIEIALTAKNSQESRIASVIAKHSAIDKNSRQQSYLAELGNSDNTLTHNQIVNVFVPAKASPIVMVPTNSITRNHFGNYVFQLNKDDEDNFRARAIKVTLGDKVNNQQVVLSGLNGNELIAAEGAFKLAENMLVFTDNDDQLAALAGIR